MTFLSSIHHPHDRFIPVLRYLPFFAATLQCEQKTMAHKLGRPRSSDRQQEDGSAESLAQHSVPKAGSRHTSFKTVRACVTQLTSVGFSKKKGEGKSWLLICLTQSLPRTTAKPKHSSQTFKHSNIRLLAEYPRDSGLGCPRRHFISQAEMGGMECAHGELSPEFSRQFRQLICSMPSSRERVRGGGWV